MDPATESVSHPVFARFFARVATRSERRGQVALRQELLAGLSGRVIEIGAGNGLNFPHYPAEVEELVAIEPEPYLRARAVEAAQRASITIHVREGNANRVREDDRTFDAAVVSGVLCSVPDPDAALRELWRVLRPGGELHFYEHVRASGSFRGFYQDTVNLLWPRLMGGCHPNRDTLTAIELAGFSIASCRRLMFPPRAHASPVAPRILGVALRS